MADPLDRLREKIADALVYRAEALVADGSYAQAAGYGMGMGADMVRDSLEIAALFEACREELAAGRARDA